jgi:HEAT repeat protein
VEPVAIGQGRHIVYVRVPAKDDPAAPAWEAILAPGRTQPIFAGLTGLVSGDPGERTGRAVRIIPNGSTSFVLVGNVREDLSLCGESLTLLDPLALYPGSLDLRSATVQRLTDDRRAKALNIVATDKGPGARAPLARLLVARGSSVPGSRGAELTDGDVNTVWSERRPGVGQGEFVVMAAPRDVPIAQMEIVVAPPGATPETGVAPKTFYLVTNTQTFEVVVPKDAWLKPGESFEISFPHPIETSCVALVLDAAYVSANRAHPVVSVAELVAYSEFDGPGATLEGVAHKLSSERGIAAAQVLERAGDVALAAVEKAYDALDARGRALAIDVAAAHERCDEAAPVLARGLCSKGGEAPRRAREKLERCKGAAPVLAKRLREEASTRACIAPTLAAIAPLEALDPIADAMAATSVEEVETRATLRAALAQALTSASRETLVSLVADTRRTALARLEIMRAAGARVTEAAAESEAIVAELLREPSAVRARYLVLGPLEELARAGNRAATMRIEGAMRSDPDWPVRARAAEAAAGLRDAQAALVTAARDPEPRVREAALQSLAPMASQAAIQVAKALLSEDGWSFVKAQAVGVLAKATASGDVDDALGSALHDRAVSVRGGALVALARHRAWRCRVAIRERLDDKDEDAEVRAAAARALGAVCDMGSADRLTELGRGLGVPEASGDAQQLALGAIVGLAALQPPDLKERLAPLLAASAPPHVRAAAQQALSVRNSCHDDAPAISR